MPEPDDDSGLVATVDLGSNSFHMVIGRVIGDQLSILDRLRDPVRLASGLDDRGVLSDEYAQRMDESLQRFRQRLAGIHPDRVRAIGTDTFRRSSRPRQLLAQASEALGYPIEVLPGAEEARLIYLGVSQSQPPLDGARLVVDIGGGSTEFALGYGFAPIFLDSLQLGCVAFAERFFAGGKVSRKAFKQAELAAAMELETIEQRFRGRGWKDCVGSSGTINAVSQILTANGWTDGTVTLAGVKKLRRALMEFHSAGEIDLPGVEHERREVLPSGIAILKTIVQTLGIEGMRPSKTALREGVLYDLLGRIRHEDVRDRTIRALSDRFHVDEKQADRVQATALALLLGVADAWSLDHEESATLLAWAARMHEIGLTLSYSGHHKHGAYILAHSDLPGFSQQEQARLAVLVRGHRRKLTRELFADLPGAWQTPTFRLCVLLRLAVRLNRTRSEQPLPDLRPVAGDDRLELHGADAWLQTHPLTHADLEDEAHLLAACGFQLVLPASLGESDDD